MIKSKQTFSAFMSYQQNPKMARAIQDFMEEHALKEIELKMVDPKTGKSLKVKKPRITVVLEALFKLGVEGKGNVPALTTYLDRALGRVRPRREAKFSSRPKPKNQYRYH